jgi:signal recognition particle GTPase
MDGAWGGSLLGLKKDAFPPIMFTSTGEKLHDFQEFDQTSYCKKGAKTLLESQITL